MGRLAHDFGWRATFLSRITRMVHRDRNHPSVIFWSLGNEAGRGRNLLEARNTVKSFDPSRPVVYESGGGIAEGTGRTELTDIISTMYPVIPRMRQLATRHDEDRPVILCEYSHSMGNSNGNLHYYWNSFWDENLPRLQGGCIWDMVDQGIRVPGGLNKANQSSYFAYGGDFNDPIHDAQFCINGMFSPDREPHPSVEEIKYLQQPVQITPVLDNEPIKNGAGSPIVVSINPMNGTDVSIVLHVVNRYTFQDLSHLSWSWELTSNRSSDVIRSGRFDVSKMGGQVRLRLNDVITRVRSLERSKPQSSHGNTYWVNIRGCLKEKATWANSGHVLVRQQFCVEFQFEEFLSPIKQRSKLSIPSILDTKLNDYNNSIEVFCQVPMEKKSHLLAKIDKQTGALLVYAPYGPNLLQEPGLTSNFVRAVTDNDKGGMELALNFMLIPSWAQVVWYSLYGYHDCSYASHWKSTGLCGKSFPRMDCARIRVTENSGSDKVGIVALCTIFAPNSNLALVKVKLHYTIYPDGRIRVSNHINPLRPLWWSPTLPRVGMNMVLDMSLYNIQYYGRGPTENYPDRKSSAEMGVYKTTPHHMAYHGYIVPSENGSRSDCEYASFRSNSGDGFCMVSTKPNGSLDTFSFSALHSSIPELQTANHTCDLEHRLDGQHAIYVNVDHALLGLGGDTRYNSSSLLFGARCRHIISLMLSNCAPIFVFFCIYVKFFFLAGFLVYMKNFLSNRIVITSTVYGYFRCVRMMTPLLLLEVCECASLVLNMVLLVNDANSLTMLNQ
jgi:beta-galactosidase